MDKIVDILFGLATGIALIFLAVCICTLPDNPPPVALAYTVLGVKGALIVVASIIGIYKSVK